MRIFISACVTFLIPQPIVVIERGKNSSSEKQFININSTKTLWQACYDEEFNILSVMACFTEHKEGGRTYGKIWKIWFRFA